MLSKYLLCLYKKNCGPKTDLEFYILDDFNNLRVPVNNCKWGTFLVAVINAKKVQSFWVKVPLTFGMRKNREGCKKWVNAQPDKTHFLVLKLFPIWDFWPYARVEWPRS